MRSIYGPEFQALAGRGGKLTDEHILIDQLYRFFGYVDLTAIDCCLRHDFELRSMCWDEEATLFRVI